MSRSLNKLLLIGNLGSDPEVRQAGGKKVASFSVATTMTWNNGQGVKQERTEWHRCQVWGGLADVVEKYVHKGDRVYLEGRVEYRQYQDKDGNTKYSTDVNVQELLMLGGKNKGAGNAGGHQRDVGAAEDVGGTMAGGGEEPEDFEEFPGALEDEDDYEAPAAQQAATTKAARKPAAKRASSSKGRK